MRTYRNVLGSSFGLFLRGEFLFIDPILDDLELLPGEGSEDRQAILGVIFRLWIRHDGKMDRLKKPEDALSPAMTKRKQVLVFLK